VWGSRARSTAGWDVTVASASLPWTIDADVARTRGSTEDAPVDEPRSSARGALRVDYQRFELEAVTSREKNTDHGSGRI